MSDELLAPSVPEQISTPISKPIEEKKKGFLSKIFQKKTKEEKTKIPEPSAPSIQKIEPHALDKINKTDEDLQISHEKLSIPDKNISKHSSATSIEDISQFIPFQHENKNF